MAGLLKLIFVRHGETKHNVAGLYYGWDDSALTERGVLQAQEVSEKLKKQKIDYIISSDLDRTMKTAEIINQYHNIDITVKKDLREINFGLWEGLSYKEIKEKYPKELKKWENDWIDCKALEGESVRQMYGRVTKEVQKIINEYKTGNVLIVSHAGCIRVMLAYLIGRGIEDYWKYKVENCGITMIEIIDAFSVLTAFNQ